MSILEVHLHLRFDPWEIKRLKETICQNILVPAFAAKLSMSSVSTLLTMRERHSATVTIAKYTLPLLHAAQTIMLTVDPGTESLWNKLWPNRQGPQRFLSAHGRTA